jgi:hypothetical protein
MRRTFERVESRPDDNLWQTHRPGDRIVSYVVAGYAESFQRPYIFELGTEVQGHQKARYIEPIRSANDNLWIGEDYHFRRAQNGLQPERAAWESITKSVDIIASPNIPEALKDITVSVTGLVKVESQFNPKKVGANVAVGIIDRRQKRSLMLFV